MDIKTFAEKHKTELIIGGVVVVGVAATVFAIKRKRSPVKDLDKIAATIKESMLNNNLGIPNWEGMEIFEHWNEGGFQNMILKCHVCDLGKLGENMMNDMLTQCNPDVPIEMVLTYCNSAVV